MKQYLLKKSSFSAQFIILLIIMLSIIIPSLVKRMEGVVEFQEVITSISVDTAYQFQGKLPEGIVKEGKLGKFRHCLQANITSRAGYRDYPSTKSDNKAKNGRYYMWLSDNVTLEVGVGANIVTYVRIVDDDHQRVSPHRYVRCDLFLLNKGTDGDPEIKGGYYDKNAEEQFETVLASLSSESGYQFKYKKPEGVQSQGKLNSFSHCLKSYKTKRSINWVPEKGEYNQYKMWVSDHVYLDLTTRGEEAYSLILRDEENKTYSSTYRLNCKLSLLSTN